MNRFLLRKRTLHRRYSRTTSSQKTLKTLSPTKTARGAAFIRSLRSLTSWWEVSPHRLLSPEFRPYQAKSERWTSRECPRSPRGKSSNGYGRTLRTTWGTKKQSSQICHQLQTQWWSHPTLPNSGRLALSTSSQTRRTANKSAQTASLSRLT